MNLKTLALVRVEMHGERYSVTIETRAGRGSLWQGDRFEDAVSYVAGLAAPVVGEMTGPHWKEVSDNTWKMGKED